MTRRCTGWFSLHITGSIEGESQSFGLVFSGTKSGFEKVDESKNVASTSRDGKVMSSGNNQVLLGKEVNGRVRKQSEDVETGSRKGVGPHRVTRRSVILRLGW